MRQEIYKCIKKNKYKFELGSDYIVVGEDNHYIPDYDQLEPVDIILLRPNNSDWSKIKYCPKHNFNEFFKKIETLRDEKIEQILKNDTETTN